MSFSKQNLVSLIQVAVKHKASDIHIRTGEVPCLRIRGQLVPIQTKEFAKEDVAAIAGIIFGKKELVAKIDQINELDGGFAINGLCRIRYNFFRYDRKYGIIFRIVNESVPSIEELGINPIVKSIAEQRRGLVLVTGPTGSGKSTTLAAMIDYINTHRSEHIITIEDPIEYLHPQKKSRVTQREIGKDTDTFQDGLRAALRQDPDVILIGEMRDPETVQIALKAAETGHLVFSTLHTTNSLSTIGRVISMFPPEEQKDVRERLAINLYSTVSQRLLKNSDNSGVVIAQEIMITTPGIVECIEGKEPLERIVSIIKENNRAGGNGSVSFDQHLMQLYKDNKISKETAIEAAESAGNFIHDLEID
ncbi:MAG: PilT/PilU family type 4a pilus ATPase [Oligoflexia bacterium]|nr:PilT/PilU family type 4a pilus ATPase [Oligoflexia bacterium]